MLRADDLALKGLFYRVVEVFLIAKLISCCRSQWCLTSSCKGTSISVGRKVKGERAGILLSADIASELTDLLKLWPVAIQAMEMSGTRRSGF